MQEVVSHLLSKNGKGMRIHIRSCSVLHEESTGRVKSHRTGQVGGVQGTGAFEWASHPVLTFESCTQRTLRHLAEKSSPQHPWRSTPRSLLPTLHHLSSPTPASFLQDLSTRGRHLHVVPQQSGATRTGRWPHTVGPRNRTLFFPRSTPLSASPSTHPPSRRHGCCSCTTAVTAAAGRPQEFKQLSRQARALQWGGSWPAGHPLAAVPACVAPAAQPRLDCNLAGSSPRSIPLPQRPHSFVTNTPSHGTEDLGFVFGTIYFLPASP